jgi:hypothetical protein
MGADDRPPINGLMTTGAFQHFGERNEHQALLCDKLPGGGTEGKMTCRTDVIELSELRKTVNRSGGSGK